MKKPFDPSDRENALKSALNLIRFRIRSEKELFYKLKEKGYDTDNISDTVQKLKENKLLDDRLFAKCFLKRNHPGKAIVAPSVPGI